MPALLSTILDGCEEDCPAWFGDTCNCGANERPRRPLTPVRYTVDRPIKDEFVALAVFMSERLPTIMSSERKREVNTQGGEDFDSVTDIRCVLNELCGDDGSIKQSTPAIVSVVQDEATVKLIIRAPDWSDVRTAVLNDSQIINLVEKLLIRYRTLKGI